MSKTKDSALPRMRKRKVWAFRVAAILFPLLLLGVLELAFRIAGAYEDRGFKNPYVTYEEEYRYFPQWESTLATPKPAGVYRVFALGGSTTEGACVNLSFSDQLLRMLVESRPEVRWEVLNGGVTAMGSHRVYEVMREASAYEPDLYVVCMGNNEFLEDFPLDREYLERAEHRIGRFARRLRVVNFVRRVFGMGDSRPESVLEKHVARHPEYPLIHSREHYETRLLFLGENARLMIDFARSHGVRIIFVPTAPNLLCAPGDPVHGPEYDGNDARWNRLWTRGRAEYAAGRWAEAIETFRTLLEIDDQHAGAHYELGIALLGCRRTAEAREALLLANLHDQRGAHANSEIVKVILDACRVHDAETVDVGESFDGYLQGDYDRFFREDKRPVLFADHCHPTEVGHRIIAEALAELILVGD